MDAFSRKIAEEKRNSKFAYGRGRGDTGLSQKY